MKKILLLFGLFTLLFSGCYLPDLLNPPDINDSVTVELPETATQIMIPEKYDYYVSLKNQIQEDYNDDYAVLYDQWQRNLISTSEFQTQLAALNAQKDADDEAVNYRRLTEAWWQPLELEITIENSSDIVFKYVNFLFTVEYHDGSTQDLIVDYSTVYSLNKRDEVITLDTNYLIKSYTYVFASYLTSE